MPSFAAFADEMEKISYGAFDLALQAHSAISTDLQKKKVKIKNLEAKLKTQEEGSREHRATLRQLVKLRKKSILPHAALGAFGSYGGYYANRLGAYVGDNMSANLAQDLYAMGGQTSLADMRKLKKELVPNGHMVWLKGKRPDEHLLHAVEYAGPKNPRIAEHGSPTDFGTAFNMPSSMSKAYAEHFDSKGLPGYLGVPGARLKPGSVDGAVPTRVWKKWGQSKGGVSMAPELAGPHVAAHELGHQSNAINNPVLSGAANFQRRHSLPREAMGGALRFRPWEIASAAVPMGMATLGPSNGLMAKASPFVGAAMAAPLLLEEGLASLKGYRAMKRLNFTPEQLAQARLGLGRAWGTYAVPRLLAAAAPAALVVGGRQLMDRYRRKVLKEETYGETLQKLKEQKALLAQGA